MRMNEMVNEISKVVCNLTNIKLLNQDDLYTNLCITSNNKYVLTLSLQADEAVVNLCLEMFHRLRNEDVTMTVVSNKKTSSISSLLTVKFYEE